MKLYRKWTRCSDKMPPIPEYEDEGYIVQANDVEQPFVAYWDGCKWNDSYGYIEKNIIAWMPLPKPFREKCEKV